MPIIDGQHEYRQLAAAVFMAAKKDLQTLRRNLAQLEASESEWVKAWIERNDKLLRSAHRAEWRRRIGGKPSPASAPFVPLTDAFIKATAHRSYRGKLEALRAERDRIYDLFSGPSLWSDVLGIDDVSKVFDTLSVVHV